MFKQRIANLFNDGRTNTAHTNQPKDKTNDKVGKGGKGSKNTPSAEIAASKRGSAAATSKTDPNKVLVERDRELTKLMAYWQEAVAGRGRLMLIAGEAGFGKSCLADFVAHIATTEKRPHKIAQAACSAQCGQDEPFWPFADTMSQLVAAPTSKKLTNEVVDAFLEFAPSWVGVIPVAGPVVEASLKTAQVMRSRSKTADSPNPEKLLREYTGALKRICIKHAVLMIIDDLHWSDAMSIRLLSHLARNVHGLPCLIIGTYRPSDIAVEGHPLNDLIAELLRLDHDAQLELQPLSEAGVRCLLDKTYPGHKLPDHLAHYLAETTGGAPLFVVESLRLMQRRGELKQDEQDGRWTLTRELNAGDLPDNVEAIINKRLERLPAELQDMLAHAAVAGPSFDAAVLAYVLGKDELQIMKLLEPAENEHDVIDYIGDIDLGADVTVRYRFTNNLFQRQLLETLRGKKRLLAFRRTAEGLDRLWPDDSEDLAPTLAQLYEEGKVFESAARFLIIAGHYARQAGNITRAIELYERAERNLNRAKVDDATSAEAEQLLAKERQNIDEALSYLYEIDSSYDKSELRTRRALARGLDALGWRRYASLQMRLAALAARAGRLREALSSQMALLALLDSANAEDTHSYESFQLRAEIAKMQTLLGRSDEAVQEAEGTLQELDNMPDLDWKRAARARLCTALTLAYHESGDYRRAIALSEETLIVLRELNMLSTFAALLGNLTDLYIEVGDYDKAHDHIQLMRAAAHDTSNESLLALAHQETGLAHMLQGNNETAIAEFMEAGQFAEAMKSYENLPKLLALHALALLNLNRVAEAEKLVSEASSLARDSGSPEWTAYAHLARARLAEVQSETTLALEEGQAAAEIFREEGTRFDEAIALRLVGRVQRTLGHVDEAAQAFERAASELRLIGNAKLAAEVAAEALKNPIPK